MRLLVLFVILNIVNVVLQTVKSLCTIKGSKFVAATANAIAYGLYTVVIIYTVSDLPLIAKILAVGGCNFVGVFLVKWFEEKTYKEKLWKIEFIVPATVSNSGDMRRGIWATLDNITHYTKSLVDVGGNEGDSVLVSCYCKTKAESNMVKEIVDKYNVKYFASETKILY